MEICVLSAQASLSHLIVRHLPSVVPSLLVSLREHAYSQRDHRPTIQEDCHLYKRRYYLYSGLELLSSLRLATAQLCVTSTETIGQIHTDCIPRESSLLLLPLYFNLP